MNKLIHYIEEIKTLFIQIRDILDSLNNANFDNNLNAANLKMEKVKEIKEQLQKQFKRDELAPYETNLYDLAKQIEERFDNIVKRKSLEKQAVALKIEQLQNSKKLQNYRR